MLRFKAVGFAVLTFALCVSEAAFAQGGAGAEEFAEMGRAAYLTGDLSGAEAYLRAAQAAEADPSSPRMSRILNDLGVTLKHQGRYREAALALEQALILVEAKGEAPPDALAARLINLAEVNAAAGREAEVAPLYGRALRILDASVAIPIDFLRMPLIALVGFYAYGEPLSIWLLIGAAIILLANYVALRAEGRRTQMLAAGRP